MVVWGIMVEADLKIRKVVWSSMD